MDSITLQEIAGPNMTIFESYYNDVNPDNSGIIKSYEAANFLRLSGLNQLTLKNIWDLSDPNCVGYLDKKSFFVALKLTAMVQNGRMWNMKDIKVPLPPPIFGENVLNTLDWSIPNDTVEKAITIFKSLNPIDGKLSGSKVKPHMMKSNLPVDILTKVWDLSDIDKDGFLDMKEFIISCHLISKTLQGLLLPDQLPGVLLNFEPYTKALSSTASPALGTPQQILSPIQHQVHSPIQADNWVVSAAEKAAYDQAFKLLDKDNDGLVNGLDVKDTLLRSGLPQNVLAIIWNLCDMNRTGQLNPEQFALANYLIKLKQSGKELPEQLTPEMIPPSARIRSTSRTSSVTSPISEEKTGVNKEFDIFENEIKQLQTEKVRLENDVHNEEASLRLKQAELKTIENEIDSLTTMLKQLETQKNDATKRLDDLNAQFIEFQTRLMAVTERFNDEKLKVQTLNIQYLDEKKKIDEQSTDITAKRQEFENLKSEEIKLESKLTLTKSDAEQVAQSVTDTQLEISQLKTKSVELEEYERRVNDMIQDYDQSIRSNDIVRIASLLPRSITPPPFLDADTTLDDIKADFADPFAGEDPFKETNPSAGGWQANFDAFSGDPFPTNANDPFRSESPTPALPPKKGKPPPPRPAPPKATTTTITSANTGGNKTPLRAAPPPPNKDDDFDPFGTNSNPVNDNHDPFGSSAFGTNSQQGFANFANFN